MLFAQSGYGKGQKIEKGIRDGLIDGVILSPKGESVHTIGNSVQSIREASKQILVMIDPQTYIMALPGDNAEGKLPEYPHYRLKIGPTQLSNPKNVQDIVSSSLNMQRHFFASHLVSPAIIFDSFNSRNSQIGISLAFESQAQTAEENNLFVSLCIEEHALSDREAMEDYLDILCSLEVFGFYILVDREQQSQGFVYFEPERLANLMYFCYVLGELNGYEVVVGYSDFAGLPLFAAGATGISSGWFSNLRRFVRSDYEIRAGGRRPRRRFSSEILMNSILLVPELISVEDRANLIYGSSGYVEYLDKLPDESLWTPEVSCLQNWWALKISLANLETAQSVKGRIDILEGMIKRAEDAFGEIDMSAWNSSAYAAHLPAWREAISRFNQELQ